MISGGNVSPTWSAAMAVTFRKSQRTEVGGGFPKVINVEDTEEMLLPSPIGEAARTVPAEATGSNMG